jgi:thiol-disulfide isomerase/thioredoxin
VKKLIQTIVVLCAFGLLARAVAVGKLGDPAAPLEISTWVKGEPVDLSKTKGKKIVVVEFWATWCGPCKVSIPHLTEMAKKFSKDNVVFVGVSDEAVGTVKPFVQKLGDKMDYVVAIDKEKKTSQGYMRAYGANGIPHAFIVDKQNRIVWEGHPMDGLDKALERIISNTYDLGAEKKRADAKSLMRNYTELASKGGSDAELDAMGKELIALDKEIGGIQPGKELNLEDLRKRAQFQAAMNEYSRAVATSKSATEIEKLEQKAAALAPAGFSFADYKASMQLNRLFQQYYLAVTTARDEAKIRELTKQMESIDSKNAEALNNFAWQILTNERIKNRDLKLALKLAKSANDASNGKEAHILDTYARALFDNGQKAEAVKVQKQAVEVAEEGQKEELVANLKKYQ